MSQDKNQTDHVLNDDSLSDTSRTQPANWVRRARSMWIRARANAFAHKIALYRVGLIGGVIYVLQMVFVLIPIVCVGLSLHLISSSGMLTGAQTSVSLQNWVTALGVISIVSNGVALLLNMLGARFQWSERRLVHQNQMAAYQLIAQKARRLDDCDLTPEEGSLFCRHLEEIFEIYKTMGIEPHDKDFCQGNVLLRKLLAYPFQITPEELRCEPTQEVERETAYRQGLQ